MKLDIENIKRQMKTLKKLGQDGKEVVADRLTIADKARVGWTYLRHGKKRAALRAIKLAAGNVISGRVQVN